MSHDLIKDLATVLAALVGVFKYFQYKNRRDRIAAVGAAFDSAVKSLSSDDEVEQLAGAIRLRRFFDPESELGFGRSSWVMRLGKILEPDSEPGVEPARTSMKEWDVERTPYASEATNVIAAVLRTRQPGVLQKVLADGLAYSPTLIRADLQRTNLQNAYLGARKTEAGMEGTEVDLCYADFYRADLSGASLKGAKARGAVFYQARLHNTVLSGADLREANFFEADLSGAHFHKALLSGANFKDARNVPPELARRLQANGLYPEDASPFMLASEQLAVAPPRVFLSRPNVLDPGSRQSMDLLRGLLEVQGMVSVELERGEYRECGVISEIRRRMTGCAGVVVFGFRQLEVLEGRLRPGTTAEERVKDLHMATPWSQLEAGMAAMLGLPILLVCQPGVVGGIFDVDINDYLLQRVGLSEDRKSPVFQVPFEAWCAAVRERARKGEGELRVG
jgi:hypothetical protein